MFEGEAKAAAARHDAAMQAAWITAACHRSKRMPKLKDLLADKPVKKRAMSWQAMLGAATAWVASTN